MNDLLPFTSSRREPYGNPFPPMGLPCLWQVSGWVLSTSSCIQCFPFTVAWRPWRLFPPSLSVRYEYSSGICRDRSLTFITFISVRDVWWVRDGRTARVWCSFTHSTANNAAMIYKSYEPTFNRKQNSKDVSGENGRTFHFLLSSSWSPPNVCRVSLKEAVLQWLYMIRRSLHTDYYYFFLFF